MFFSTLQSARRTISGNSLERTVIVALQSSRLRNFRRKFFNPKKQKKTESAGNPKNNDFGGELFLECESNFVNASPV
jgi:hypothetical protein